MKIRHLAFISAFIVGVLWASGAWAVTENVTATPTANAVVKAGGSGQIASGWLPAPLDSLAGAPSGAFLDTLTGFGGTGTATTYPVANYSRTTGLALAWTAGDVLGCVCTAH